MSPARLFSIAALALAFAGAARVAPAAAADELPYGDVVRVAPSTLMIVGCELNPAKGEADI
jgi:hypothetical protein